VQARDNGGTANGGTNGSLAQSFTISVTAVNDAPLAFSQSVTNAEDTTFAITLTASDVDGPVTNFVVTSSPGFGILSGSPPHLTYRGTPNYHGPDNFTFQVNDGSLTSAVATVTITLTNINDAPILPGLSNYTIAELTLLTVTNTATDPDGDALSYTLTVTNLADGSLVTNAVIDPSGSPGPQHQRADHRR